MYAIKSGREYIKSFNPVSGRTVWTRDVRLAKDFGTREAAEKLLDEGEKVVFVSSPSATAYYERDRGYIVIGSR